MKNSSYRQSLICQYFCTVLRYTLKGGKRWLTGARKRTVTQIPVPTTPKQVREFLGTAGFCRLWIPGFATLVAPLYPLTKDTGSFTWTPEHQKAFEEVKKALVSSPALTLPDLTKPFIFYMDERAGWGACCSSPNSDPGAMEMARSLPIKEVRPTGQWVAVLLESYCWGSTAPQRRR